MIILTEAEAQKVCGFSPKTRAAALEPVPLTDGTYALPDCVVDDPSNADVRDFLAALPRVEDEALAMKFYTAEEIDAGAVPGKVFNFEETGVRKQE